MTEHSTMRDIRGDDRTACPIIKDELRLALDEETDNGVLRDYPLHFTLFLFC
ncbi:MAG: hypothetical protein ABIP75_10200 [Pyrinomonadaceae bacterium]